MADPLGAAAQIEAGLSEALTFDDVLLVPRHSTVLPSQVDVSTNLSRRINHEGPEDELKHLADTFDSMIDRLETSFQQQRQFVQDASHELRNPVSVIRSASDIAPSREHRHESAYREALPMIGAQARSQAAWASGFSTTLGFSCGYHSTNTSPPPFSAVSS